MPELQTRNLTARTGRKTLVENASLTIRSGELAVILGPNGAGKTSLLRAMLGLIPASGYSLLNDQPISTKPRDEIARSIAYLPQARPLAWPNLVRDIVALGRFPYGGSLSRLSPIDAEYVEQALIACDLTHLADRQADTLSGGELGRVHCARAFATNADFVIADEPVAALDPLHQFRIMELFRQNADQGKGVVLVLHDIALAARFADHLIWMQNARIVANGSVEDTLTTDRMAEIYGVEAQISGRSVSISGPVRSRL